MHSVVIRNAQILTMAGREPEVLSGDLVIEQGQITAVGPAAGSAAAAAASRGAEVIDATGMLAMPGLINGHNHGAMTLFRAYCDDLRLMDWLQRLWPVEDRLTGADVYWGTLLACAEMIRSGTTAFADMYVHMEEAGQAVADSGMRGVLARGLVFPGGQDGGRLAEARRLFERWQNGAGGRIRVMVGPHAPYTVPPDNLRDTLRLADELGAGMHIHLSETGEEQDQIFREYGKSPARYLYDLGMFDNNRHVLLAHCVHLSRDDIHLIRGFRGGISHNPISNLKLACGVAPVLQMRDLGLTVGLGTDGAGSATTLDMFAEIKAAAWLQKQAMEDPARFDAWSALRMATIESARVLGLEQTAGSLEVGKRGDVILMDLEKPHLYPRHDLVALVAYAACGSDVDTVIVDGRVVMRQRRILAFDEAEVMRQANARALRLVRGD